MGLTSSAYYKEPLRTSGFGLKSARPRKFLMAAAAVALAVIVRFSIEHIFGEEVKFVTFFLAVIFATWYGGIYAGVFALGLSLFLVNFFFISPRLVLLIPDAQAAALMLVYGFIGGMGLLLMQIQRTATLRAQQSEAQLAQAQDALRQHRQTLEVKVQERTKTLQNAMGFLQEFLYSMAHEIRQPVRAMCGFSEILLAEQRDRLDDHGRAYCRRINAAAQRLDGLIGDLLDYGRLSHETLPVSQVDLNQAVERACLRLGPQTLRYVQVAGPLPRINANQEAVHLALINVLSNALKFIPPGTEPKVSIWMEQRPGRQRLTVQDGGIGIAPEHFERIFKPFQRLHDENKYPGSGIGLALASLAMQRMGGKIGVESEPGKGSRFWLDFAELPTESLCLVNHH